MKTREEVLDILAREKPFLQRRYKVSGIALFGSYARGEQTEQSDVDILVEVDPTIGLEFVSLAEELEERLGVPVDLISTRAVSSRHRKVLETEMIDV